MKLYSIFFKHLDGQAKFRIAVTLFAVMLATIILSSVVALGQGYTLRIQKESLLSSLFPSTFTQPNLGQKDAIYTTSNDTQFGSYSIKELGVRKTNQQDDLPAGLTNLPQENELWVSPALKRLIDSNPLLQERYAQYTIRSSFPHELTASPESLLLLYKIKKETILNSSDQIRASSAESFQNTYSQSMTQNSMQSSLLRTVSLMVGVILVFPVLLLVVEAARIGIVQREKRYAVLSLVGATNSQMRSLAVLETVTHSVIGVILGTIVFILLGLPALSLVPISGSALWVDDLTLSVWFSLLICGVIVICSIITSLQILSLVSVTPLAVSRTQNSIKKPSIISVAPLVIAILGFFLISHSGRDWYNNNIELGGIVLSALLLTLVVGIFLSGSLLTYVLSKLFIKISGSASSLIAAYRLRAVPQKIFHSVSGIIIALFVGTLLMTFFATMQTAGNSINKINADTNSSMLLLPRQITITPFQLVSEQENALLFQKLLHEDRFKDLSTQTFIQKWFVEDPTLSEEFKSPIEGNYFNSCEQLRLQTQLTCDRKLKDDVPVVVTSQIVDTPGKGAILEDKITEVDHITGTVFHKSYNIIVKNDSSFDEALKIAQNISANDQRSTGQFISIENNSNSQPISYLEYIKALGGIISVMIIITITAGGLNVMVSVAGSLFERKKAFTRLRITGADTVTLAKSLVLEIILPLVSMSIITICIALFCCYCLLLTMGTSTNGMMYFSLPSLDFWVGISIALIGCVLLSLLNIPLLMRLTDYKNNRTE